MLSIEGSFLVSVAGRFQSLPLSFKLQSLEQEAKLHPKNVFPSVVIPHSYLQREVGPLVYFRTGVLLQVRVQYKYPIRSQGCGVNLKFSHDHDNRKVGCGQHVDQVISIVS